MKSIIAKKKLIKTVTLIKIYEAKDSINHL